MLFPNGPLPQKPGQQVCAITLAFYKFLLLLLLLWSLATKARTTSTFRRFTNFLHFLLLLWSLATKARTTSTFRRFTNFPISIIVMVLCHKSQDNRLGNTQISILLLCFLYLFVELMITMNE